MTLKSETNKDPLIHVHLNKEVFLDQDKFFYPKEDLDISMLLQKRKGVEAFSGILLSSTDNSNITSTLIIDWEKHDEKINIILLNRQRVNKFSVSNQYSFSDSIPINIRFYVNFKQDHAVLSIANDTIHLKGMGFSIKNGYKFAILPVLSVNPEPNVPPVLDIQEMDILVVQRSFFETTWYWFILIIVVDLLIFLWIHLRRRKKKRLRADVKAAYDSGHSEDILHKVDLPRRSAIYFFGSFQVYDAKGEDITKRFSPLLKELLSALILHTSRKGISSDGLNDLFWYDKDRVSAKNNRAVNLGKLRSLLNQVGNYELSNETGYWKFESETIFVDYIEFVRVSSNTGYPHKEDIEMLMSLTEHGNLLQDAEYSWLDIYKSAVSDTVLETLWKYANSLKFEKAPDVIIGIADRILAFENINEQALYLKCKALSASGRHSSAKKVYDKFRIDYEAVYGVAFKTSFTDILAKTSWES